MRWTAAWLKPILAGLLVVTLGSVSLAASGEIQAMLAWWMAIALLLAPLVWALSSRYVTLIVVCASAFMTQFMTLPFFYVDRDDFAFARVKPFGFTAAEAAPMLGKVALFLVSLVGFFKLASRVTIRQGVKPSAFGLTRGTVRKTSTRDARPARAHWKPAKPVRFAVAVALTIMALVPVNVWMFSHAIGIVGVEPPRLPFKLSGLLVYSTRYVGPLVLGLLYWKTRRNLLPAMLLLMYALILGLSSTSRSALTYVMLPVIAFAWLDRRRVQLALVGLGMVVGFGVVTAERTFVELVTTNTTSAVTDTSFATLALNILNPQSGFWNTGLILRQLTGMFDRLDGFRNLVMAQYYDPRAVVGALGFVLRMIYRPLAPMDADQHHLQWLGYTLPLGFADGGALLSNAVVVGNQGLAWVVLAGLVAAITLAILERCTARLVAQYRLPELLGVGFVAFMTINYFIETGGSSVFVMPLLFVIALSALPPLVRTKWMTALTPVA